MYLFRGWFDYGLDYANCYVIAATEEIARQQLCAYQKKYLPYQTDELQRTIILTKHELDKPLTFVDSVQV